LMAAFFSDFANACGEVNCFFQRLGNAASPGRQVAIILVAHYS